MEPRIATMELMNEMHVVSSFFPFLYAFFLQKVACQERNEMLLNFSFFVLRLKQRDKSWSKTGQKLLLPIYAKVDFSIFSWKDF